MIVDWIARVERFATVVARSSIGGACEIPRPSRPTAQARDDMAT